jgi:signal recognition particle GTPase
MDDYIEDSEDTYLILIKYTKPIIGEMYNIKDNDNYVEVDEKVLETKIEVLKEDVNSQIYRNLISQIETNENSIKTKESVNVDMGSKNLVTDEIYSNISTKVNKSLLNDV